jgi:hypothetical protein
MGKPHREEVSMSDLYPVSDNLLRFDRILYFIGLPALVFNYGASAVISLLLGATNGASQVSLLIYVLFIFPLALAALFCTVWAQFTARLKTFNRAVRAALSAVIIDIVLIGLFFVPSNEGTSLKPVANPNSVLSHLGVPVAASDAIATTLLWAMPLIMVWLIVAAVLRARENQAEFDDSFNLH